VINKERVLNELLIIIRVTKMRVQVDSIKVIF